MGLKPGEKRPRRSKCRMRQGRGRGRGREQLLRCPQPSALTCSLSTFATRCPARISICAIGAVISTSTSVSIRNRIKWSHQSYGCFDHPRSPSNRTLQRLRPLSHRSQAAIRLAGCCSDRLVCLTCLVLCPTQRSLGRIGTIALGLQLSAEVPLRGGRFNGSRRDFLQPLGHASRSLVKPIPHGTAQIPAA